MYVNAVVCICLSVYVNKRIVKKLPKLRTSHLTQLYFSTVENDLLGGIANFHCIHYHLQFRRRITNNMLLFMSKSNSLDGAINKMCFVVGSGVNRSDEIFCVSG
jgi:hypothetical protein